MPDVCPCCGGPKEPLDPELQLQYCFRCGIPFYPEPAPVRINARAPTVQQLTRTKELCVQACRYYKQQLQGPSGVGARRYLEKRRVSMETADKFEIGYASNSQTDLKGHLTSLGYTEDEILQAGLISKEPSTGTTYDHLRSRLIFPLQDPAGQVVGFSGRRLDDVKPKYLNSHASTIYSRRGILYNYHRAAASGCGYWILTEGYMDVISMVSNGFSNTVCSMGTELSESQIRLLSEHTKEVVILYDADDPGAGAMYKAAEKLSNAGLYISGALLSGGHDPDSFIRAYGPEEMKRMISYARDSILLPRTNEKIWSNENLILDACRKLHS